MPRLSIDSLGQYGLITDRDPTQAPLNSWSLLHNAVTQDGMLRSAPGDVRLFELLDTEDAPVEPKYHGVYRSAAGEYLIVVSDGTNCYLYDLGGAVTDITPEDTLNDGRIQILALNGVLVVNSNTTGPFYWPGTGSLEALPGWDAGWTCEVMVPYRYYLVALGMTEGGSPYPVKYRWSSSAGPGEIPALWVAAPTNDAGSDVLGDTPGHIMTALLIRDALYVVKEDAIYAVNWVGGTFVMQAQRLHGGVGCRAPGGTTEMMGALALFTQSDLLVFDGTSARSLVDTRVRRALKETLNDLLWDSTVLFAHSASSTLWVCYPTNSSAVLEEALIYNWVEDTWGHRSLQSSYGMDKIPYEPTGRSYAEADVPYADETTAYGDEGGERLDDQVILYQTDGATYWVSRLSLSYDPENTNMDECYAERLLAPMPDMVQINRAWIDYDSEVPLTFTVGASECGNACDLRTDAFTLPAGAYRREVDPLLRGKWAYWRVGSLTPGSWKLRSIELEVQPAGDR